MFNGALSFEMAAMPQSTGLTILIKVMINEVNSAACTMLALQNRKGSFSEIISTNFLIFFKREGVKFYKN